MANYETVARTNYFRVTDEEKFAELVKGLCGESVSTWTKEVDGQLYHAFGGYSLDYKIPIVSNDDESDYEDYDFDTFWDAVSKILPEDEAILFFEAGNEKLRYVVGYVIVCTRKETVSMSLDQWGIAKAKELVGENYTTGIYY